jgi:hypothetical protein
MAFLIIVIICMVPFPGVDDDILQRARFAVASTPPPQCFDCWGAVGGAAD